MTYEENLKKAKELGYQDASCMACGNLSSPKSATCKKCIADTPAFTAAVKAFMKPSNNVRKHQNIQGESSMKRFEILAKLHGLDLNKNEHNYLNPTTGMCHEMYEFGRQEQQVIIDKLQQEVCDLSFAARAFQHVLDNPVKQNIELGVAV